MGGGARVAVGPVNGLDQLRDATVQATRGGRPVIADHRNNKVTGEFSYLAISLDAILVRQSNSLLTLVDAFKPGNVINPTSSTAFSTWPLLSSARSL